MLTSRGLTRLVWAAAGQGGLRTAASTLKVDREVLTGSVSLVSRTRYSLKAKTLKTAPTVGTVGGAYFKGTGGVRSWRYPDIPISPASSRVKLGSRPVCDLHQPSTPCDREGL